MDASSSNRTRAIIAQVHQSNNSNGSNNSNTGKPIKQKHRHHHHHHHHNHNQQQQQYLEQHQQLQHNQRQQNDNVQHTLCTNGCRFHYDSSSPSFPDLTPPMDMPQQQQQQSTTNNVMQVTQQQQQQQQQHQHHTHHSKSMNRNKPQFPDDPDTIEFCLDEEPAAAQKYYKECNTTNNRNKHKNHEPHVRWSRNNIAVTMERFQPIASPSSASESSSCASSCHQDYSYAYYEPGAIMCHSNIPTPDDVAGPSTILPPPNSMRALLLKTKEKSHKTLPANRHTYTTRYGTHENIYEDVSDEKNTRLVSSEQSLSERGCTKKEFQHILNNHYRVLEELNLSVEELLMSTTPPQSEPSPLIQRTTTAQINGNGGGGGGSPIVVTTGINGAGHVNGNGSSNSSTTDILSNQLASIEIKDETRSPISEIIIGEDSGFSGSSSGASYIGSLRNYKTAITRSLRRSSAPNCVASNSNAKTVYGSCRTAKFPQDIRQGTFYNGINNNCINGTNNNNNCNINGTNNNCNLIMPTNNTIINCKSDKCHQMVDDHNPQQKGVKFSLWSKRS